MKGHVYVLTNKSMQGLVKIGFTTRSVKERMKELNTTGLPYPFVNRFSVETDECEALERRVHKRLKHCRPSKKREFFKIDVEKAIEAIKVESSPEIQERFAKEKAWIIAEKERRMTQENTEKERLKAKATAEKERREQVRRENAEYQIWVRKPEVVHFKTYWREGEDYPLHRANGDNKLEALIKAHNEKAFKYRTAQSREPRHTKPASNVTSRPIESPEHRESVDWFSWLLFAGFTAIIFIIAAS